MVTAGRTAFFSGITVAAAMAALAILPQRFLYSMAVAGASVGLLSAIVAVLVVPSMLALLGTRIDALSIRRGASVSAESDGWYRLARGVMRHPVGVALASSAFLLAAAAPLLWTTLTGPNSDFVPHDKPAYEANSYVEAPLPARRHRGGHGDRRRRRAGPAQLARLRQTGPGGRRRRPRHPLPRRLASDVAYANFALAEPATSGGAQDAVKEIRDLPLRRRRRSLVSGNTAGFIDQKQSLADHLPLLVTIIASTTLLILFLLTGSVMLPLKTLLMNAMTLGATLGIVVLAFQDGLARRPLRLHRARARSR